MLLVNLLYSYYFSSTLLKYLYRIQNNVLFRFGVQFPVYYDNRILNQTINGLMFFGLSCYLFFYFYSNSFRRPWRSTRHYNVYNHCILTVEETKVTYTSFRNLIYDRDFDTLILILMNTGLEGRKQTTFSPDIFHTSDIDMCQNFKYHFGHWFEHFVALN